MLELLIVEGNVKESRNKSIEMGSLTQSDLYQKTLYALADDLTCTIVYPADEDAALPTSVELDRFDGIVWTGSALNIYDGGPAIDRQIEFMKHSFDQETRIFGSCWGLQVATMATGGMVTANAKGREIGVARDIRISEEGLSHPLYAGKSPTFDAVAVHLDHVTELPPGSRVLSGNEMSQVQAVEIKQGRSVFWGVQYHPEFDLEYISVIIRKYENQLIEEGFCEDSAGVEKWADDLAAAQRDSDEKVLKGQYCLGSDVLDSKERLKELSNWLSWLRQSKFDASDSN